MTAWFKRQMHLLRIRWEIAQGIRWQRRLRKVRAERARRGWQTRRANERGARA